MIHSRVDMARKHRAELWLCMIDPITLTGLALAAAGTAAGVGLGGALAGNTPAPAAATPAAPPAPSSAAPPVQQPVGSQKSGGAGNTPSFIGSAAIPSQVGYGQKTLLGQ